MSQKITPEEFLKFARDNYEKYDRNTPKKDLVNIFGCISKGFCAQVDEFFSYLNKEFNPNIKNTFRGRYRYILRCLNDSENIIHLYNSRNDLEHQYKIKSYKEAEKDLKDLKNFINSIQKKMKFPPKKEIKKIKELLDCVIERGGGGKNTSYFSAINKFLNHYPKDPYRLSEKDAHEYLEHMEIKEYKSSTISTTNTILRFFYKNILKKEYNSHPKFSNKKLKIRENMKYSEIKNILNQIHYTKNRLYLLFSWYNGLRTGELSELKIEDLSELKLNNEIKIELKAYLRGRINGFVFLNRDRNQMLKRSIQNEFKKAFPLENMEYMSLLDIRQIGPAVNKLKKEQIITRDEVRILIKNIDSPKYKDIIYFIYHFGISEGQFINIKRKAIIFDKQRIVLKKTKYHMEGNKKISKYIMGKLKKYCEKNNRKDGKIFMQRRMIQRILEKAKKESGIKKEFGYHILSKSKESSKLYPKN